MALNINDISAVTKQEIVPEIVDEYYKVSPVFVRSSRVRQSSPSRAASTSSSPSSTRL
jgi:hypothetical protein